MTPSSVGNDPIRVVIADDDSAFRRAIRALLADEPDIDVVAEASDGEEAIALVTEYAPNVVLMDVRMPLLGGVRAAAILNEIHPSTKVVMLTVSDDDSDLFGAIKAGATGYILKTSALDDIADVVRDVSMGNATMSSSVATKLLAEVASIARRAEGTSNLLQLTSREMEILQHVTHGLTTHQVGEKLDLREGVVKHHVRNIIEKFHVFARIDKSRKEVDAG